MTEKSLDPDSVTSPYCRETEWTVERLHDITAGQADIIDQMGDLGHDGHTLDVTFGENGVPQNLRFNLTNGEDEE